MPAYIRPHTVSVGFQKIESGTSLTYAYKLDTELGVVFERGLEAKLQITTN